MPSLPPDSTSATVSLLDCLKIHCVDYNQSKMPLQDYLQVHNLHWLPISFRIQFQINLLTFKALHGSAPPYLASMLQHRHARPGLRSSGSMLLVPRTRLASYGDRAFSNLAPRLWNSLPQSLRDTHDISHFQNSLKTHLFRLAFEHI